MRNYLQYPVNAYPQEYWPVIFVKVEQQVKPDGGGGEDAWIDGDKDIQEMLTMILSCGVLD